MDLNLTMIIIIILFGFIAAFIDSVVGGGGLISTPALLKRKPYAMRMVQKRFYHCHKKCIST
ncbi:hypothetical protein Q0O75_10795, partial [Staphylococcus aureus]|nr:hypothetical protein [Staphylococcus aureus]MDN8890995.1 hypothetical protein [Staphylococcus aureus]MDN8898920.1 hypothetical protein [Staphylococcus aureus]